MRRIFFIVSTFLLFALVELNAYGQMDRRAQLPSQIIFDTLIHDFGTFAEVDGPVSHTFTYRNVSQEAYLVGSVSVSCGCTTPEYSKEPLMPGGTAEFKVVFDPTNRGGEFEKVIYIQPAIRGQEMVKLYIHGQVIPRPRTIEDDYPIYIGHGVRASTLSPAIDNVALDQVFIARIGLVNIDSTAAATGTTIGVASAKLPNYIRVTAPQRLGALQRGEITIEVDGRGRAAEFANSEQRVGHGHFLGAFNLITNNTLQELPFSISAVFVEGMPERTLKTLEAAPMCDFNSGFYHFSVQPRGAMLEHTFTLKNMRDTPLVIYRIEPSSDRITVTTAPGDKMVLGKGEVCTFHVALHSRDMAIGQNMERFWVYTNDPLELCKEINVGVTLRD